MGWESLQNFSFFFVLFFLTLIAIHFFYLPAGILLSAHRFGEPGGDLWKEHQ